MTTTPKRLFTEEARSARSFDSLHNNGVDADLSARLRNMASRVRKSVTEGYASSPVTPKVSPTKPGVLPFSGALPFRSANDTLGDVMAHHEYSFSRQSMSRQSNKRKLALLDEAEGNDAVSDDDFNMDEMHPRSMKPLRSLKIKSTPAGVFGLRRGNDMSRIHSEPVFGNELMEEEDWSNASFSYSADTLT